VRRVGIRDFRHVAQTSLIKMILQWVDKLFSGELLRFRRIATNPNPGFDKPKNGNGGSRNGASDSASD
jgi:hypothetical protein